jgi:hypothetical protein
MHDTIDAGACAWLLSEAPEHDAFLTFMGAVPAALALIGMFVESNLDQPWRIRPRRPRRCRSPQSWRSMASRRFELAMATASTGAHVGRPV